MEKQLVTIKRALAQLDACCEEIANKQATMEANIHHTIGRLHQTLDVRKTELIGQLHRLTQAKLKSLTAQRDQIETTQARLSSCLHFMRENLKTANQGEALMTKSATVRQVKELTTTFQPDLLEPNTEADIIFSALADITAVVQNYGQVYAKGLPDLSKCTATGKGVEVAAVGKKSTALLQTLSFDSHRSNTMLAMTSYVATFGQEGSGKGQFNNPKNLACDSTGNVYVADYNNDCIQVFTAEGKFLRMFGRGGKGKRELDGPYGVAIDSSGRVYVSEFINHRVSVFTSEDQFVTSFGKEGSGPGQFVCPAGLAVDSSGVVYVCDCNNVRVQIF